MADIKLFSIIGEVQEVKSSSVALEKELQALIENNMEAFFGVRFLDTEYKITNGRIDSIGLDENNCPVIFEYKRSTNENVINQGLFYLDWLLDHKADFYVLVLNRLGKVAAEEIDWSMPCVICIASDFTKFDEHAVNQMQRNIKLVRYKKYNDTHLLFEQLNAPTVSPIAMDETEKKSGKGKGTSTSNVTFKGNYEKAPEAMKVLYTGLRDYIVSLGDDVSVNELKLYVAFKKVKNIICAEIYNKYLIVQMHLNPETVELAPGFIEDYSKKGHWGTGDLRVTIKTPEDFERIKSLIDRAYNEN
jgi:predicted transport protein